MIDPSIPLQVKPYNLAEIMSQGQQLQLGRLKLDEAQQAQSDKQTLRSLLPLAAQGDKSAIQGLYAVDPKFALELDTHQKEAAAKKVADLSAAVQWADTPEKWDQVINHYGTEGVDLSAYRGHFDKREQALLSLGQMGEYLKATQPKVVTTEAGGAAFAYQPGNPAGTIAPLIAPNDGSQPMGASVPPPPARTSGTSPVTAKEAFTMLKSADSQTFLKWQERFNVPVLVSSPKEAALFPPGTLLQSPDGRQVRKH